ILIAFGVVYLEHSEHRIFISDIQTNQRKDQSLRLVCFERGGDGQFGLRIPI
ncbi:MAG: hypothetical protein Q9174_004793, partial [Haloplaca sp. 1 TL-2023]